jgi:hypothetical protein
MMAHDYELAQRLTRIEAILERIDMELNGNGQPGKLQVLRDDVDSLIESRAKSSGAIAVIGALLTAVGSSFVAHLWWGKH